MMSGNQDKEKLPPLIAFDATEAIKAHFPELDYPVVILTSRNAIPASEDCLARLVDRIHKLLPDEFKIKLEQTAGSKEAEQTNNNKEIEQTDSSKPKKRKTQKKIYKPTNCCAFAKKMPGKKSFIMMPAAIFNYLTTNNTKSDKSIYDKNIYKFTDDYLDLTINPLAIENKSKLLCLLTQMHTYINSLPELRKQAVEFKINAQVLEEKYENFNIESFLNSNANTDNSKWDNFVPYNVTNCITDETFTLDGNVVKLDKKVPLTMVSFPTDAEASKKQAFLRKQAVHRKYLKEFNSDSLRSPFSKSYHNLIFILSEIFDHSSMSIMSEEDFFKKQKAAEITTPKEFSPGEKIKFQTYFDNANNGKGKKTPGNLVADLISNRIQFDKFFPKKLLSSNEPYNNVVLPQNESLFLSCVDATIRFKSNEQQIDQDIQNPVVNMELDVQSQQPITTPTLSTPSSTQSHASSMVELQQSQDSNYLSFSQLLELYNQRPQPLNQNFAYSNYDFFTNPLFPLSSHQSVQNRPYSYFRSPPTPTFLPTWMANKQKKRKEASEPSKETPETSLDLPKKQKTSQQPSIVAIPVGTLFEETETFPIQEPSISTVSPETLFMEDTEMLPIQDQEKLTPIAIQNEQKIPEENISIKVTSKQKRKSSTTKNTTFSQDVDIPHDPERSQTHDETMLIGYEKGLSFLTTQLNSKTLPSELRQEIKKLLETISESNETGAIEKVNYLHKRFRKLKVNVSTALKEEADRAEKEKSDDKKAAAQYKNQIKLNHYIKFVDNFSGIFGKYYNNAHVLPKQLSKKQRQNKKLNRRNDEKLFQDEILANKANFIYQAPVSRLTNLLNLKVIISETESQITPKLDSKTIIPKEIFKNILSGPIKSFKLPTIDNFEHNPKIKEGIKEFQAGHYQNAFDKFHSVFCSYSNKNPTSETSYTDAFYSALYIEEMCELLCSNLRKAKQPKNIEPCDSIRTMLIQEFGINITTDYDAKTKKSTEYLQTTAKSPAEIDYARDHLNAYTEKEIVEDIPVAKTWMKDKKLKPVILKKIETPTSFLHKTSQVLPNQFGRHQLFMNAYIFTNHSEIGAQLKSYFDTILAPWNNLQAQIEAEKEKEKAENATKAEEENVEKVSDITNPNRLFQPAKEVTPPDFSDVKDRFTSQNTDFARNILERSIEKQVSNDKKSDNDTVSISSRKTTKARS